MSRACLPLFLLATLTLTAATAHAATVCVDPTASLSGTGRCWTDPYPTIRAAIDHTGFGDTIKLARGVYTEDLRLDGVGARTILGAGVGLTIIRPARARPAFDLRTAAKIIIRDVSFDAVSGIEASLGGTADIENCSFTGGQAISGTTNSLRIVGNLFTDLSIAVSLTAPSGWSIVPPGTATAITDNDFVDVGMGVIVNDAAVSDEVPWVNIMSNRFEQVNDAIDLRTAAGRATIGFNYVGHGINGLRIVGGSSITAYNNIFDGNSGDAVRLETTTALIVHNTMVGNGGAAVRCTLGVYYDTAVLSSNAMLNNGAGLDLATGCHTQAKHNAGYGNRAGDLRGLAAPYDLGGNLARIPFALNPWFMPTAATSPLVGAAFRHGSALFAVDYYGVDRLSSPDIGAVEYAPLQ